MLFVFCRLERKVEDHLEQQVEFSFDYLQVVIQGVEGRVGCLLRVDRALNHNIFSRISVAEESLQ